MGKIIKNILIFFLLLLIFLPIGSNSANSLDNCLNINNDKVEIKISSHKPIYIFGNKNFSPDNGVVSGNGTIEDPYLIEKWDIETNMTCDGIRIENTDKFFIIQNCYIHYVDGITAMYNNCKGRSPYFRNEEEKPFPLGIYLNNVSNGVVRSCKINGSVQAMCLNNSYMNVVSDCFFYKNLCGIGVKLDSYDNIVKNCYSRNYACGVCLYQNATRNIVEGCVSSFMHSFFAPKVNWMGYHISDSKDNFVCNCSSFSSGGRFLKIRDHGFIITNSSNNTVKNFLCHGLFWGLTVNNAHNNSIVSSKMLNNIIGFYINIDTYRTSFKGNCLIRNGINAIDFSKDNVWDNNYWDDWVGLKIKKLQDKPYNVPGRFFFNFDLNPNFYPN